MNMSRLENEWMTEAEAISEERKKLGDQQLGQHLFHQVERSLKLFLSPALTLQEDDLECLSLESCFISVWLHS
jgi:hypothetical protein